MTFFGMPGTKQHNMPVLYDGPVSEYDAEQAGKIQNEQAGKIQNEVADETPNDFIDGQK